MIDILSGYFKSPVEKYEQIHVGNSASTKASFSVGGKHYFAKMLLNSDELWKYGFLASVADHIPEAVVPFAFPCDAQGRTVAVSIFAEGCTLDTIYHELSFSKKISVGEKTGAFLKRLHTSVCRHSKEERSFGELDIVRTVNKYAEPDKRSQLMNLIDRRIANAQHADKAFIHRDIRPQNIILLPDGNIRIIDFENAEIAPPLYELSLCLMLSSKYYEFAYGVVRGYCGSGIPEHFWKEEKEHIAWQLLEYSLRFANESGSIQRKFDQLTDYITSEEAEPIWWKSIDRTAGMKEY